MSMIITYSTGFLFDGCCWLLKKHSVGLDYSVDSKSISQKTMFRRMAYFL